MKYLVALLLLIPLAGCFETVESRCSSDDECFRSESCVGGTCVELVCPDGQEVCDGTCVDPMRDRTNCGACGVPCELVCSDGACLEATQIAVGGSHACALVGAANQVACWGDNDSGQLGREGAGGPIPELVQGVQDIRELSAGLSFTCALLQSGSVSCWGSHSDGQLGRNAPAPGESAFSAVPEEVFGISDAVAIAAGERHACVIRSSRDEVQCWGSNLSGALGTEDDPGLRATPGPVDMPDVGGATFAAVDAGRGFSCVRTNADDLICWGANDAGQSLGGGDARQPPMSTPYRMTHVSLGSGVGCGVLAEGERVCWGRNQNGQLGRGSVSGPMELGEITGEANLGKFAVGMGEHVCAIAVDSQVWCWGQNSSREAVPDSATGALSAPVNTGLIATQVEVGVGFTCVLDEERITCWGDSSQGRLGPYDITSERERPAREE